MLDREEISELRKKHLNLEKRIRKIGERQCASVSKLSEALNDILENIEATVERDKELWNPDISTKIKLAKKGIKLSKKLKYFEAEVVKEFEAGNISQDIGKRFIAVIRHMQNNKMADAKKEFRYLLDIAQVNRDYEASKEEIEKKDAALRKKQLKAETLLKELSAIEKQSIDSDKVQRYEELLKDLQELEKIRTAYISSLCSKPITELLDDTDPMRDSIHVPEKEKMEEIRKFFSENPELGGYRAEKICELFDFNEKKLSHVCHDSVGFRRVIRGQGHFFETLRDLRQTKFLEVDDGDKSLAFYAEKNRKIVERIRILRKDKVSCKNEYEKKLWIGEKRKELSKYSKEGLEAELREAESLVEFLHSEPKEEKPGLFSRLTSFFKGS